MHLTLRRQRDSDLPSIIDRALSDLEDECMRLRAHNRQLHAALSAAMTQVFYMRCVLSSLIVSKLF
jgi:environmental stress-induced protein Ves